MSAFATVLAWGIVAALYATGHSDWDSALWLAAGAPVMLALVTGSDS